MSGHTPSDAPADRRGLVRDLVRLWAFIRPYRGKFFLGLALLLLAVPLGQLAVFMTRDVTNRVLNAAGMASEERWSAIVGVLILQAGFWLSSTLLATWREVLEWYVSMRSTFDLRLAYYRHLHRLPMSFLSSRAPGEHLYRATADMVSMFRVGNRVETSTPAGQIPPDSKEVQLTYFYSNDVDPYDPGVMGIWSRSMPLFLETIYALGWGILLLALIDPVLSLMLLGYIVPFAVLSQRAFKQVQAAGFEFKSAAEHEARVLRDSIRGMRVLKAFGRTGAQLKRYFLAAGSTRRAGVRLAKRLVQAQNLLQQTLRWAFTATVYVYLARRIVLGKATIGDWVATALLIEAAQMPLQNLVQLLNLVKMQIVPVRRIVETLAVQPTLEDAPDAVGLDSVQGRIEFSDVTFSYVPNHPVLHAVTLTIQPGEHVGIVGPSGAGKSSLVNLALRLYAPDSGSVRIDDVDLNSIKLASYLDHVASVPQSTFLYTGTVRENILFGNPDASEADLDAAVRMAGVDAFLTRHDDGLDTPVGESAGISGGERQRIGIARALVRNPKVLFLDETTASLDPASEEAILETIESLRSGRTLLTIAHRLKAVVHCDRILVLDQGRIVEQGTHAELVKGSGLYSRLWHEQNAEAGVRHH